MNENTTAYGYDETDDEDWLTAGDETPTEEPAAESAEPTEAPEVQPEATTPENQPETKPQEDAFELTYDGKAVQKSRAEMIQLAQIGMNQQRAVTRAAEAAKAEALNTYRPLLDGLDALAAGAGVNAAQLLDQMAARAHTDAVEALMEKGVPEAEAEELVSLREKQRPAAPKAEPVQATAKQEMRWDDFIEAYPHLVESYSKGEAPQAFKDGLDKGLSPMTAQMAVELAELKAENKKLADNVEALKAAEENRKKAPPAVGSFGASEPKDPFEAIFDED